MPTYTYRAVDKYGKIVRNRVEETSKLALFRKLKSNDLSPIDISTVMRRTTTVKRKKRNTTNAQELIKQLNTTQINQRVAKKSTKFSNVKEYLGSTSFSTKVPQRDLVVFTQNFYLLKKANFNNVHALSTIIEGTENMVLVGILEDILAGVESGDYMYKTMEYYPEVFPYIYVNMIRVGELSGSLENSLKQAVEYLDSNTLLSKKLRNILIPNLLQFVLLIIMLFVGGLYALPEVESVIEELGAQTDKVIPKATLVFQDVINAIITYWPIPVAILVAIIAAIVLYIQTPKGKYKYHYFKYTMPLFGKLIFSIDFSRLMKAMLLNLRNGMRVQEALDISKNVVNNYVMLSIIEKAINNVLIGEQWIEPFETSGLASPMCIEMLKIGMQTDLPEMMDKLVDYMEFDINNTIETITKVLPQVLYSIVGIVLIIFVIVVLVPMIQLYFGNFLFDLYLPSGS